MKPKFAMNSTIAAIETSSSLLKYHINILSYTPQQLGLIQECFAFLYFNIHKPLFDIKEYVSYSLSPPSEIKKITDLGLSDRDMGTDGVIFHNDGEISLVQVKWRTKKEQKHNRSVFDGMAIDGIQCSAQLKHLILFSNCIDISDTLPKGEKFKYILYTDLLGIDWKFFKAAIDDSKELLRDFKTCKPIVPILKPRKWQIEAKKFVDEHADKCTIVAPCGSGKTLFGHTLFSGLESYKVLIIVPSLQLLSQWFCVLAIREPKSKFLLVGSKADGKDIEIPYTLTTDKKEIRKTLNNCGNKLITICTYQSLDLIYQTKFNFSMTLVDEAHWTATKEDGLYSIVTKDDFQTDKKIFLTATPKIFKGRLKEIHTSMDDESIYGEQFVYSTRQAINDKILCDYIVDLGYYPLTGKLNKESVNANFLDKSIDKHNLTKILVTSTSHASNKRIYDEFEKVYNGSIKRIFMKENASPKKKNEVLAQLEQEDVIIFSVNIFNLGIDMPSLQAVMFNDDRKSKTDIIQTAMRCLRTHKGKEKAHILIPAFIGDDLADTEQTGDYPFVRNTLNSLGSQDIALFEEIYLRAESAKQGVPYTGSSQIIQFVSIDDKVDASLMELKMFDRMGKSLNGEEIVLLKARDCIEWSKRNERFPIVSKKKNKTTEELIEYTYGSWLKSQRQALNGTGCGQVLYPSVINLLNQELPGWSLSPEEHALQKARDLINWYIENRRLPKNITKKIKTKEEVIECTLAVWLNNQKFLLNGKGNGSILYPSVKKLLDENIPEWCLNQEQLALQKTRELIKWYKEHDRRIPITSRKKNKTNEELIEHSLAQWLGNLKQSLNGKGNRILYPSVKKLLDKEIPEWCQTKEQLALTKAKEYIKWYKLHNIMPKRIDKAKTAEERIEHGHAKWFARQKQALKGNGDNRLYPSVKKLLEDNIPGIFD